MHVYVFCFISVISFLLAGFQRKPSFYFLLLLAGFYLLLLLFLADFYYFIIFFLNFSLIFVQKRDKVVRNA